MAERSNRPQKRKLDLLALPAGPLCETIKFLQHVNILLQSKILNFWPHPFNEFIPHPSNSVNHHFGVLTAYVTKSIEVIKVQSVQIFGLTY